MFGRANTECVRSRGLLWTIFLVLLALHFEPEHVAHDHGEVLADRGVDPFKNESMKFKENI
jgi:hypothetical protein